MAVGCLSEHLSKAVDSVGSSRSEGGWLVRWLLAECVAAILAVLVPFAYASPPDPSWIPGIYDYHDYDDVVGMVTDGAGVSDSQVARRGECVFMGFVLRTPAGRIPGAMSQRQTIRGPPIEMHEASADPLLPPVPNALPQSSILLIASAPPEKLDRPSALRYRLCHPEKWGALPPPRSPRMCPAESDKGCSPDHRRAEDRGGEEALGL